MTGRAITYAVALALALLNGCDGSHPSYPPRQTPAGLFTDAGQITAGHALFLAKCASCHGHPGEGRSPRANFFQPPAPLFSEPVYRDSDPAYLFWRIEVGKTVEPFLSRGSVMPAWGGLPDQQIWQLVAYLMTRTD